MFSQVRDKRLPDRFWSKVQVEPSTGCWIWTASLGSEGRPRFSIGRFPILAVDFAYRKLVGELPKRIDRHSANLCGNAKCVNPGSEHFDPTGSQFVSATCVAEALGVDEERIHEWRRAGVITSYARGRQQRYRLLEVTAALEVVKIDGRAYKTGPRGDSVRMRAAERNSEVRTCAKCRRPFPRSCYPPSAGRTQGWHCPDCRRPYKRAADAKRRQVIDAAVEHVSHIVVARRDDWKCGLCGGEVTRETWSLDHVIPLSKGGTHTYDNVVLAHLICNSIKGARLIG